MDCNLSDQNYPVCYEIQGRYCKTGDGVNHCIWDGEPYGWISVKTMLQNVTSLQHCESDLLSLKDQSPLNHCLPFYRFQLIMIVWD